MRFKCDGLELSEAIAIVSKAISNRTTSQILEGIKVVAGEDKLVLTATDLEMSIVKTIRAEVFSSGETVVPGRLFGEYIKKLTNEQIECELNEKNQLKISYTDSEGVLQCMEISEFPDIKEVEKDNYFEIKNEDFKSLINNVYYAVAQDDSRPILKGILLETNKNSIKAVAVDGCRLSISNKILTMSTADFKIIVPGRNLNEIVKMLESEGSVKVRVFAFRRRNHQVGREAACAFLQKQVHAVEYGQHDNQGAGADCHPHYADGGDDIDGILLLFGKKITPRDEERQPHGTGVLFQQFVYFLDIV